MWFKASLDCLCWSVICLLKFFLSSISILWKRKGKQASKDRWERIPAINQEWVSYISPTHRVPTQQFLHVSAFCYEKQKTGQHPRCCLKHWEPIPKSVSAGIQTWTCHLRTKYHRSTDFSEMDFHNHAVVLNNLPHQAPVRNLKTYSFVQSRPSDPWCGAFHCNRDGTDCFAVTLWNIQRLTHPQIKVTQGWHFFSIRHHYWTSGIF